MVLRNGAHEHCASINWYFVWNGKIKSLAVKLIVRACWIWSKSRSKFDKIMNQDLVDKLPKSCQFVKFLWKSCSRKNMMVDVANPLINGPQLDFFRTLACRQLKIEDAPRVDLLGSRQPMQWTDLVRNIQKWTDHRDQIQILVSSYSYEWHVLNWTNALQFLRY